MKKPRTEITNDSAKFLLSAYRPNGADAQDPVFHDALEQAARDPELGAWLREQRDFDSMIVEKLSGIQPPATLRSAILAGIENRPRTPSFSIRPFLALAALILLSGVILVPMFMQGNFSGHSLARYQQATLAALSLTPAPELDLLTPDFSRTQEYLADRQAPRAPVLPASLRDLSTAGCKTLQWNGHALSLTCFRLPSGELLHLFVIDEKALAQFQISPDFQEISGWHVKCERVNGMLLMFVSRAPMAEVKQYVEYRQDRFHFRRNQDALCQTTILGQSFIERRQLSANYFLSLICTGEAAN